MATAEDLTQTFKAPDFINYDVIHSAEGVKFLNDLASQFDPPINLKKCDYEEKKERLRCGLRRAEGKMRDLQAFSRLMSELKESDTVQRATLSMLFASLDETLAKLEKKDSKIHHQLQQETTTREYNEKIKKFLSVLARQDCPIVVAGQVSSGKSSLMNLFLGEDYLPSQLLSCTATICELAYGEMKAELIHGDGKHPEEIPFEDKNIYIYKKSERERKFEHEAVRLYLPVSFLKSGILLVDTPGVGENNTMGNVVLDYVSKRDIFGFIFVINCNDSGGVLQRFKDLIRKLAAVTDSQGQRKLDPKSVIFVANFWDKVPDDQKGPTYDKIVNTLRNEKCLEGFEPSEQLFFMNTDFALRTWKVGLISEHHDRLIGGVEHFFPIGHRRKLKLAYLWLEAVLVRTLHPVNVFLNKVRQSARSFETRKSSFESRLRTAEDKTKYSLVDLENQFEDARKSLRAKLNSFLQSEEATSEITKWSINQIPKEEFGDTWVLIEERLDQAIDDRISSVLQNWEAEKKYFIDQEKELIRDANTRLQAVNKDLRAVEKDLRTAWSEPTLQSQDTEEQPETVTSPTNSPMREQARPEFAMERFSQDVSLNLLPKPESERLLDALLFSPSQLFSIGKMKRVKAAKESAERFQASKTQFMSERSRAVITALQSSASAASDLVASQLSPTKDYLNAIPKHIFDRIASNRSLIKELGRDKRERPQIEELYGPVASRLNDLLEAALEFKNKHIKEFDFYDGVFDCARRDSGKLYNIGYKVQKPKPPQINGLFGVLERLTYIEKQSGNVGKIQKTVTLKTFKSRHNAPIKHRHIFYMASNLRNATRRKQPHIAAFLGTYEVGPSFVFDDHLFVVRQYLCGNTWRSAHNIPIDKRESKYKHYLPPVLKFYTSLGLAIEYLHLRKFVHLDLSLDSILVDKHGNPKLTNIFESMEVPFPKDVTGVMVGDYLYMPPETHPSKKELKVDDKLMRGRKGSTHESLPMAATADHYDMFEEEHPDRRYVPASDVYALGLMAIELYAYDDVFIEMKRSLPLNEFFQLSDPGKELLKRSQGLTNKEFGTPENIYSFVQKCLKKKPQDRLTIKQWRDEWEKML